MWHVTLDAQTLSFFSEKMFKFKNGKQKAIIIYQSLHNLQNSPLIMDQQTNINVIIIRTIKIQQNTIKQNTHIKI